MNAILNGIWVLGTVREAIAQRRWRDRVATAQARTLLGLVRRSRDGEFGRRHGFANIRSVDDYRGRVPLSTWDDYADAVRRLAAGEPRILTEEPVLRFVPTGGSLAGPKLVPYTRELQREFSRGIDAWVFNLFAWRPALAAGRAFFSVTPFGSAPRDTPSGIPVGFDDDTAYLGGLMRRLGDRFAAVPRAVAAIAQPDAYRYVSLLFLLARRDLALISVWNPTFLEILLGRLDGWAGRLVEDLGTGRIGAAVDLDTRVREACQKRLKPDRRRAGEVGRVFGARRGRDPRWRSGDGRTLYESLWPRLRVISCWADANAEEPARRLKALFPGVDIQPKGLLSTEGVVSFPLGGSGSSVLATRSHFLEFIDPEDGGAVRLAHELARGRRYEVVMTTGGGLYRYRTRDVVEVTGFWGSTPMVRFVGRADMVSDLYGEKLAEGHVRTVVREALRRHGIGADFWMVAPETAGSIGCYVLFIQPSSGRDGAATVEELARATGEIETGLRENPQYRHCIRLGQLGPLRVFRISERGAEDFLAGCIAHGQRLGDVKPPALHRRVGWAAVFRGAMLP